MITVCPKCALTLAVTAVDLRVGQGQVRCGRCAAVFNALAGLQDDLAETMEQSRPPELAPEQTAFDPVDTDIATPGTSFVSAPTANMEDPSAESAAPGTAITIDTPTSAFAGKELAGELADALPEAANDADTQAPPSANDDNIDPVAANDESLNPEPLLPPLQELEVQVESVIDQQPADSASVDRDPESALPTEPRHPRRWLWGSVGLVALLASQFLHINRESLAARDGLRAPLSAFYGLFGVTLQPRWQPAEFAVQRRGEMVANNQGAMTLRATVHNRAANSQPLPLLRIILLDRFGARIAARDLLPAEYLPATVAANLQFVGAGQRLDAEVTLADPGINAAGFELDACLRMSANRLQCASQTERRP